MYSRIQLGHTIGVLSTLSALNACAGSTMPRNAIVKEVVEVIMFPFFEDALFPWIYVLLDDVGQLLPTNLKPAEERKRKLAENFLSFLSDSDRSTILKWAQPLIDDYHHRTCTTLRIGHGKRPVQRTLTILRSAAREKADVYETFR